MRIRGPDRTALHARAEVLARRVDRILAAILTDAAANIGASVVHASGLQAAGGIPAQPHGPASPDDLNGILTAWLAALGPLPHQRTPGAGGGGLMGWLQTQYATAAEEQLRVVFTALGYDLATLPSVTLLSEAESARTYLAAARNRLVRVGDTIWHEARTELTAGLASGEAIPTLAARITGLHDIASARAQVIARTEVLGASNQGSLAAMRSTGLVATKEWITEIDGRQRPDHEEANGQVVSLDESFTVGDAELDAPGDPNGPADEVIQCFPAGTAVAYPAIRSVTRRWYEGDLVRVRFASGHELTGTANHPVLRSDGWVALGQVTEGDHLIRARLTGDDTGAPDVEDPPSPIGEVYRAAHGAWDAVRVGGAPPDFHGDGRHGEVEVVPVHGPLRFHGEPAVEEQIAQFGLTLADQARSTLRDGQRRAGAVTGPARIGGPSDAPRGVAGASSGPALFGAHRGHADDVRLGLPADMDSRPDQPWPDGSARDPVASRDAQFALAGRVPGHDLIVIDGDREGLPRGAHGRAGLADRLVDIRLAPPDVLGDLSAGRALLVSADEVIDVGTVAFAGHVFNLDTGVGWYTADGIPCRNCRCTLGYSVTEPD